MTFNPHPVQEPAVRSETAGSLPVTQLFCHDASWRRALAVNVEINAADHATCGAVEGEAGHHELHQSAPGYAQALYRRDRLKDGDRSADLGARAVQGRRQTRSPACSPERPRGVFIGVANVLAHIRAGTITALVVDDDKHVPSTRARRAGHDRGNGLRRGTWHRSYFGLFTPPGGAPAAGDRQAGPGVSPRLSASRRFARQQGNPIQRGLLPAIDAPKMRPISGRIARPPSAS